MIILEIPGFHYDTEKKRYYKIQPDHKNVTAGVVTKNTIRQDKIEKQRQNDLQALHDVRTGSAAKVSDTKSMSKTSKCNQKCLLSLITSRSQGDIRCTRFFAAARKVYLNHLRPMCSAKVIRMPASRIDKLWHMQKMYCSGSFDNRLICLWSLKDVLGQRLQSVSIDSIVSRSENIDDVDMTVSMTGAMIRQDLRNITSMCCARVACGTELNEYVLYTTTKSEVEIGPSMAMIRKLNCSNASDFRYTDFNLGKFYAHILQFDSCLPLFLLGPCYTVYGKHFIHDSVRCILSDTFKKVKSMYDIKQ